LTVAPSLRGKEVLEHLIGEELVAMVGEKRLDAPIGHELTAQCRRVEQFTVEFAESLHPTILDDT
jgi:hypothetical protein